MVRTKHVQARVDPEIYSALQRWAQTHNLSLTKAVDQAIRALTGFTEQPSKAPKTLLGLLADTDVMEEMERERISELAEERKWR